MLNIRRHSEAVVVSRTIDLWRSFNKLVERRPDLLTRCICQINPLFNAVVVACRHHGLGVFAFANNKRQLGVFGFNLVVVFSDELSTSNKVRKCKNDNTLPHAVAVS